MEKAAVGVRMAEAKPPDPSDDFFVKLVTNPVTTWWIRNVSARLDPVLHRATNGRFTTMGPAPETMITITVNGQGQTPHDAGARGKIIAFHTSDHFDFVAGEAAEAYDGRLDRFTRSILFVKPDLILIYDQLKAPKPATFEWWLHAPTPMTK